MLRTVRYFNTHSSKIQNFCTNRSNNSGSNFIGKIFDIVFNPEYTSERMACGGLLGTLVSGFLYKPSERRDRVDSMVETSIVITTGTIVGSFCCGLSFITIPVILMWLPSRVYYRIKKRFE